MPILKSFTLLFLSKSALACPFCDQGGIDAAKFILSVFVPFAIGVAFILFAVRRLNKAKSSIDPSQKIFDAEKEKP